MLPLLNIERNPCPCLLRADTPELNLTWSCLVGVRLTWAEPHLILLVPSPQFILASSSRRPAELSGLILMDQWPPVGVIFLTPHVPVCFHTPYPHVCHKPYYFTNLYSLPSSSFSVVRTFTLKSSWSFTLKDRLPALRGFSVRVESQGLESGTELVREDWFYTNLFTCFCEWWWHFEMINLGKCFPLLSFTKVCIQLLSSVSVYTVY